MKDATSGTDRQIFGKLGSVSLNDIIQLLGMSKRTATLELRSGEARGRLYFRDGQIVHANAGSYEGEESYIELLGWADAEFAIEEGIDELPKVSITKSTEALLLSTMTTLDEIDRLKGNIPIQVSPSIVERRRPPRPQRHERRSRRQRTTLLAGASATAVAFLVLGVGGWYWVAATGLEESFASSLPPIMSPPSPEPVAMSLDVASVATADVHRASPGPAAATPPPSSTSTVVAALMPGTGYLTVVVEPWARIEIDGLAVGETPLGKLELSAGAHLMTLVNDNVVGHIQDEITLDAGETVVRRYSFEDVGFLRLVATPWANVRIDGRAVGQTPLGSVAVPAGVHSVTFTHPELGSMVRDIEVAIGQTTLLRVQLQ